MKKWIIWINLMQFPIIKTIDDVLPAIKGHDEFIVAERPFGTVINYVVQLPDSFDDPIRRECRGIIFYPDGTIMSRPFHKFFNVGEKNESRPANLDFDANPIIMDKLDGSMIRPVFLDDRYYWELGTKMGLTDVAAQAHDYMRNRGHLHTILYNMFRWCKDEKLTPLFEWCSRKQRIVVDYPNDRLVLTAIRRNYGGEYFTHEELLSSARHFGVEQIVDVWSKLDYPALEEMASKEQNLEGWVVAWPCGKRVKMKVDWYVNLHKVKECIAREKYVIEAILGDFLDDLKGKLLETDLRAVEHFEVPFRTGLLELIKRAELVWQEVEFEARLHINNVSEYLESPDAVARAAKKRLAEVVGEKPRWMQPIMFGLWDGKIKTVTDGVVEMLKKMTQTQPQIDSNRHLWGGAKYQYGGVNIDA